MAHRLHLQPASLHDDGIVTMRDRMVLSAILELNLVVKEADLFLEGGVCLFYNTRQSNASCLEREQLFYPPIQLNFIIRKHLLYGTQSQQQSPRGTL